MTAAAANICRQTPLSLIEEARELLRGYPALAPDQLQRLIDIFAKLPILDVGMMSCDNRLAPRLAAFQREHGRKIKMSLASILFPLSYPIIMTLVVLWATFRL